MMKRELVSAFVNLQEEVSSDNNMVQSLRLQRDWVINKQTEVMEILELIGTLKDARDAETRATCHSVAITARPSSIDQT